MQHRQHKSRNAWSVGTIVTLLLVVGVQRPLAAELPDIIAFVESNGWRADFGSMCVNFGLASPADCVFRQISVRETEGNGYPRGINVPPRVGNEIPYILLFHLTPLVGEFHVVSAQGELLKTFYRAKGRGYDQVPNNEFRDEFIADLKYWMENFERLRAGFDSQTERQRMHKGRER